MPRLPAAEETSKIPGEAARWGKLIGAYRLCLCAAVLLAGVATAQAEEWIPGYTAANGAYVPGYWRSDGSPMDNYSNLHNVNPYAARPRQKPENYGAYVDPNDDGSSLGADDSSDGGDGDGGGEDGD